LFREWPTNDRDDPRQRGERTDLFTFDKADSDKDDLLSYVEIETCWRNSAGDGSSAPLSQHGRTAL